MRHQVGGVGKSVSVTLDVTGRFEAELEALYTLIGVIARTEVRVHDGLHHLLGEVEPGEVRDGDSHCC
jgi:hypothetical protein